MTKRIITLLLATILLLGLLTACGNDTFSVDDAKKLVCEDLGIKEKQIESFDHHLTTIDSAACYLIYISAEGKHWQYTVNSLTGEIIDKAENATDHSHSH